MEIKNFWKNKKVFITGHTGFKGAWLSLILNDMGAEVTGYSLESDQKNCVYNLCDLKGKTRSNIGNLLDLSSLEKALDSSKPDVVLHLAAQSLVRKSYSEPLNTFSVNVIGTANILEAVKSRKNIRSVVVVTTDKCYENKEWEWPYRENDRLGGHDPYSASKACAELVVSCYQKSFAQEGQLVASARAGNVIGGGDWAENRLIPDVFRSLIEDQTLAIRNPGAIRPWQHVLDPLLGYLLLAQKLYEGDSSFARSWNFGPSNDNIKSVKWIVDELSRHTALRNVKIQKDDALHEANILKLDSSMANNKLLWAPKLTIEKTIEWTAVWYRALLEKGDMNYFTHKQIQSYFEI